MKWELFVKICKEIENFLTNHNEIEWSKAFTYLHRRAMEANDIDSRREVVSQARTLFGGMGSFSDLVIGRVGQMSKDENQELDEMRDLLYDTVMEMSGR